MFIRILRTAGARFRLVLLAARGMVNTRSQAGLGLEMTVRVVQVLKSVSQRVFMPSMAVSQDDRILGIPRHGRDAVGLVGHLLCHHPVEHG